MIKKYCGAANVNLSSVRNSYRPVPESTGASKMTHHIQDKWDFTLILLDDICNACILIFLGYPVLGYSVHYLEGTH